MSFAKDENNQVHKSDTGFNKDVVEVIGIVKNSHDVKECINALVSERTANSLREDNSKKRIDDKKEWTKDEIGIEEER